MKWKWHERFIKASEGSPATVVKPILRNGKSMTVAVVEGDYRKADKSGKIDLDKTLDTIQEAQKIYNKAVNV